MGASWTIRATGSDGIESVGHRDDPGAERDVQASETIGIAFAVHLLMMVTDDIGDLGVPYVGQHVGTVGCVKLDDRVFVVVETPRIVEDLPGGVDLADVVNHRGRADLHDFRGREMHRLCNTLCLARHPLIVPMSVGVTCGESLTQFFE